LCFLANQALLYIDGFPMAYPKRAGSRRVPLNGSPFWAKTTYQVSAGPQKKIV
jgi:hypothetical protein